MIDVHAVRKQVTLGFSGTVLFAVTPNSLYSFNVASLTWINGGAPLAVASPNTQFRGVARAPAAVIAPSSTPSVGTSPSITATASHTPVSLSATPSPASATPTQSPWTVPAVPFSLSSMLVSRVGDGAAPLGTGSVLAYLDEFSPSGTRIQSLQIPYVTMFPNNPLISQAQYQTGVPSTLGLLTRSPTGAFVSLVGPIVALGTAYSASTVFWAFANVDPQAAFDTTTVVNDRTSGDAYSNAVTNGTGFWSACTVSSSTNSAQAGYSVSGRVWRALPIAPLPLPPLPCGYLEGGSLGQAL